LISRGKKLFYSIGGEKETPQLYALVVGTSDYRGDELDLNYAAKDANDFAKALQIVGDKFFGADKVDLRLLTTENSDFNYWPTKENIERSLKLIGSLSKPNDVLIIYLSGHGTTYGGAEGDFYYLTSNASNGNLIDPVIRKEVAISTEEFTEYIKQIPALKQVMIIDACYSGQLAEDLLAKKEGKSSSEKRALERMKDRIGMYILSGSAADAVSYEASIHGQGLLTYSLLFGMKGAALRENKFVDIMTLFQFAADKVPELAKNIGGVQKPEVRVPYGGQSFDIGISTEAEQAKIVLPSPKPLFVRSVFQNDVTFNDDLRVSKLLNDNLRNLHANETQQVIYIDASNFTDAYSLKGRYLREGAGYRATVRLFKGDELINGYEVSDSEIEAVVRKIIEKALTIID